MLFKTATNKLPFGVLLLGQARPIKRPHANLQRLRWQLTAGYHSQLKNLLAVKVTVQSIHPVINVEQYFMSYSLHMFALFFTATSSEYFEFPSEDVKSTDEKVSLVGYSLTPLRQLHFHYQEDLLYFNMVVQSGTKQEVLRTIKRMTEENKVIRDRLLALSQMSQSSRGRPTVRSYGFCMSVLVTLCYFDDRLDMHAFRFNMLEKQYW